VCEWHAAKGVEEVVDFSLGHAELHFL
jgi:hypothetical protein